MFRFTIRELLLLTVIVALAIGWWMEHSRFQDERKRLNEASDRWRRAYQREF